MIVQRMSSAVDKVLRNKQGREEGALQARSLPSETSLSNVVSGNKLNNFIDFQKAYGRSYELMESPPMLLNIIKQFYSNFLILCGNEQHELCCEAEFVKVV